MKKDGSAQDALDLCFVNQNFASSFSWNVLEFNYGSDHFPTIIKYEQFFIENLSCRPHFNISKVDWVTFKNLSSNQFSNFIFTRDVNTTDNNFLDKVTSSLMEAGAAN